MNNDTNNFDLIRLFAALQVVLFHSAQLLDWGDTLKLILNIVPGVPIFFFVSGFLIMKSYQNATKKENGNRVFFTNRVIRLYPALYACFVVMLTILIVSGYLKRVDLSAVEFVPWVVSTLTIFQFYNPEFIREFGTGVLNGSLWTVSVEIQFYLLTPALYYVLHLAASRIWIFLAIFVLFNVVNNQYNASETVAQKLYFVSFLPWFYMFVIGAIVALHEHVVHAIRKVHFIFYAMAFILIWKVSEVSSLGWGNQINPIGYLLLAALVIKVAYINPELSNKILRRNDFSYGIYIYHMPVVNLFLYKGIVGFKGFAMVLLLTACLSVLSWFFIEKRALQIKSKTLRRGS